MNEQAKARIVQFRTRLSSISRVSFRSRSGPRSQCGWSGAGEGTVAVDIGADDGVRLVESGHFQLDAGAARAVPFRNVFRFTFDATQVALSHERRGAEAGVWLFDLVAAPAGMNADLVSREAHLCVADRYRAQLRFVADGFDLEWTISGPRKDEHLRYRYR